MHQQNNIWQRIKIALKILLVFAVIFQEFFIAKTRKYMVLLSINIITIDLTSLFDYDPKNGNETSSISELPKEPEPSLVKQEEKSESNWNRNLIILCVGVGCFLVAGGLLYYYFGPVADVTVASSTVTPPPTPITYTPPIYNGRLVLQVFGYQDSMTITYLQTHCASLDTDFMDFTKILALTPHVRKNLLKALDTMDGKELDRIIPLVCDMAKSVYKK